MMLAIKSVFDLAQHVRPIDVCIPDQWQQQLERHGGGHSQNEADLRCLKLWRLMPGLLDEGHDEECGDAIGDATDV